MTLLDLGVFLLLLPVIAFAWAYGAYPLVLRVLVGGRPPTSTPPAPVVWPGVTLVLPACNEAPGIRDLLETVLALDYPADRLQRLVVSDASTDGTDEIVRAYARRGIELLRMPRRMGKTAAENAAIAAARHPIVVNIDASTRVPPPALKALVRVFQDPTVGVASGRDISVGARDSGGEAGYVGYEMWIRRLETQLGSIVGASGCFYAIRRGTHEPDFPVDLSRDFASVLMARERGYRSVSVEEAVCFVPRASSLSTEHRRKIRTMSRGIRTLLYKRHLMNPAREGLFAIMLISHKLMRWIVYLALPPAAFGALLVGAAAPGSRALLAIGALGFAAALSVPYWPVRWAVPRGIALAGFLASSALAGVVAWLRVIRGERAAVWEPTRRPT